MDTNFLTTRYAWIKRKHGGHSVLPSILKGPTMPSVPTYMYNLLSSL